MGPPPHEVTFPISDLRGMATLMDRQSEHLLKIGPYLYHMNRTVTFPAMEGGTNVLDALTSKMAAHYEKFTGAMAFGLAKSMTNTKTLADDAEHDDAVSAEWLRKTFPPGTIPFPKLPIPRPTSYQERVEPGLPMPGPHNPNIVEQVKAIHGKLGEYEEWFQDVIGESLLVNLTEPLLGDWGQFNFLATAYSTTADAYYDIAANLRVGAARIDPVFHGQAGQAFSRHIFRWHMGIGGVGDLHLTTSYVYQKLYYVVVGVVTNIVKNLYELATGVFEHLRELLAKRAVREFFARLLRNLVTKGKMIPYVGNLIAAIDLARLLYYGYRAAQIIQQHWEYVSELLDVIEKTNKRLQFLIEMVDYTKGLVTEPAQWYDERYQSAVKFEKVWLVKRGEEGEPPEFNEQAWSPGFGMWRIGFLNGLLA